MDFKTQVVNELRAYVGYRGNRNAREFPPRNARGRDIKKEVTRTINSIYFECMRTSIRTFSRYKVILLEITKTTHG